MTFSSNSTEIQKNIFRHETKLKWIKALQTPFRLGFNDNIYHEGNISKIPDFNGFFLYWMFINEMGDLVVYVKMVI